MTAVLPIVCGLVLVWSSIGWCVHRSKRALLRAVGVMAMVVVAIGMPVLLWTEPSWTRGLATLPMFLYLAKTAELATGRVYRGVALDTWQGFAGWAIMLPEAAWPRSVEERSRCRGQAGAAAMRFVAKAIAFVVLLGMNEWLPVDRVRPAQLAWMSVTLYVFMSGVCDAFATVGFSLGFDVAPMFNSPLIARNPRDFWGRRWNLWFTRTAHRLIFEPTGGRAHPVRAGMMVFFASGLLHEVIATVGNLRVDGQMTAFFMVHGGSTMAFTKLSQQWPAPLPRALAVALHFSWFMVTAPLFLDPMDGFIRLSEWDLSGAAGFIRDWFDIG
ncbi:MAG: MBOAT family protein [Myxococcota bacterium]|nr:MBOAT family protein [Myxococcota bacterium]